MRSTEDPSQVDVAAHGANLEISLDWHVKDRMVELDHTLEARAAINPDAKFWITLRDGATLESLRQLRQFVSDRSDPQRLLKVPVYFA